MADQERISQQEAIVKLMKDETVVRLMKELAESNKLNQKTTLREFLQACHENLHKPLGVETTKSWTTKGLTSPGHKYYPKALKAWEDFSILQDEVFSKVCDVFHPNGQEAARVFSPILSIEDQGRLHCRIQIANEARLRSYQKAALEVQVTDIISRLSEKVQDPHEFDLGQGIIFENDPNSLSDLAKEVTEHMELEPPRTPPSASAVPPSDASNLETNVDSGVGRTRADQYCIYRKRGGERELLFVVEYKAPHKLSIGDLVMGFREMDLKKEVIDRIDIPNPIPQKDIDRILESEQEGTARDDAIAVRLQYNADKVAMAVATQTFHYMIENGLEYSYISTGEAFVFLRIQESDPTTLYYHVAVPNDDVSDDDANFLYSQTAIGQVVSLCLMAFKSRRRDQKWRRDAKNRLERHPVNSFETVSMETPTSERKLAARRKRVLKSPLYRGRKKATVTSHYNLRSGCKPSDPPQSLDDEQDDPDDPSNPARPTAGNVGKSQRKALNKQTDGGRSSGDQGKSSQNVQRQYCTQKCLLGITRGSPLDKDCPNASLHPKRGNKHTVDQSQFLNLVRAQLAEDLDHDCEPLGLQGARGALFRITLASHGYVVVGKGTVQAFVPDLLHEGKIYRVLSKLQGTAVPVYLGNINLLEWYYLDVGVRILHMLLMSWGGNLAEKNESFKAPSELRKEIERTTADVQREGVDQMDIRPPNLLWNEEMQRVMLIDFERATMTKGPKGAGLYETRVLQEISPNKKRKRVGGPKRKPRRKPSSV